MDYIFLLKAIAGGLAAVGFAVLFNTDKGILPGIFAIGFVGIFVRTCMLDVAGLHFVIASLIAATTNGFISHFSAVHFKKPPLVIAIPSVIPMVPGIFLYRMMLGIVRLTGTAPDQVAKFQENLSFTIANGSKGIFVLMCLAIGISMPYLVFRKHSLQYLNHELSVSKLIRKVVKK